MKRLLGLLGLTCLVVLTACFYLGDFFAAIFLILCCVLFVVSLFIPKLREEKSVPTALLTALVAISVFLSYTYFYVEPLTKDLGGKQVNVTATQLSAEDYVNGFYTYKLKVTSVDDQKSNFKIFLRSKAPFYTEPYDIIKFPCELRPVSKSSDASVGVFLQTYLFDEVNFTVVRPDSKPLWYHLIKLRSGMSAALFMEMDFDTASFSKAVFLGERTAVSPELRQLLRTTGLSHIAVVSGLHLSIITLFSRRMFYKIFGNRIVSGCFTIISILFFVGLTGFGISVIRSAVMLTIHTLGSMIGRKGDSLNSIGGAALLLLCINPYAVGDVGMLLSFASTLGIVLWSKKLSVTFLNKLEGIPFFRLKFVNWLMSLMVETVSCSICATVWTLPITILAFKGFSLVSLLANLLVVPLMMIVLLCIGGCVAFHYISFLSFAAEIMGYVVTVFYDYLVWICSLLSRLPFAYIYTKHSYIYFWLIISVFLAFFASVVRKRFVTLLCILLSLLTVFSCSAIFRLVNRNKISFHITDTGYGQSVIMESTDGYAVLCAEGTLSKSYLLENKIDTMSVWGKDVLIDTGKNNSTQYCRNLANQFDYECILRYHNTDKILYPEPYCEHETFFNQQYTLNLWDRAVVELIPLKDSVAEYVSLGSKSVLILPGGVDCEQIPSAYRCADYLIVHGNLKSAQLLNFEVLVTSQEEDFSGTGFLTLVEKAKDVKSGSDIVLNIETQYEVNYGFFG